MPPLFAGGRLVVYGFLGNKAEASEVVITAATAIKPFRVIDLLFISYVSQTTIQVDPKKIQKGEPVVVRLAARNLIKDLEETRSYLHENNGALIKGKTEGDVTKEIIKLSSR